VAGILNLSVKESMNTHSKIDARIDLDGWLTQVETSKSWFEHRVLPLSIEQLRWRPDPGNWSVAECLDHLNLMIDLCLPKVDEAIGRGRQSAETTACPDCDRAEIEALALLEPPVKVAGLASWATMPRAAIDPDCLVERFHCLRDRYADAVRQSGDIHLMRVRIAEPVYPRIHTLGGTLALIAAHDRRHLWQAERVIRSQRFPRVAF
jgi:DinB superfamily